VRHKLVGNAVTVGVARWIGRRLRDPGAAQALETPFDRQARWPVAAHGAAGKTWAVEVSAWPMRARYRHLSEVVDLAGAAPLSQRAAAGFASRAGRSRLRFAPGFLDDVAAHLDARGSV